MAVQLVTAVFSDPLEFSSFLEKELKRGRAIVKADAEVDLFDEVILRVVANGGSVDIVATVAHPALPDPTGAAMLGLAVNLTADQRHGLDGLLESFSRQWTISSELDLVLDLDIEITSVQELASTDIGLPVMHSIPSRPATMLSQYADMFDTEEQLSTPAPDTPVNAVVFAAMVSEGVSESSPAYQPTDPDRLIRGSVDAIIDSVARGEASSERDAFNREDAGEAARYRAQYPDKAMRGDDYFRAGMADVRNQKFELARTNVNLAIAYNPTVAGYRELLERVELELGVLAY